MTPSRFKTMYRSRRQKHALLKDLPCLYAENFGHLTRLFPNSQEIHGAFSVVLRPLTRISVEIIEQCRYTTILGLTHKLHHGPQQWLPSISLTVRVYHDAKLAEVIEFQKLRGFKPSYPYPNKHMHQPLEKRQINLFFRDWLLHCLATQVKQLQNTTVSST